MKLGKIIGTGNTASVHDWNKEKYLSYLAKDILIKAIEKEYRNAVSIWYMNFLTP